MRESSETVTVTVLTFLTAVPFLSIINERPIVSIKSCVSSPRTQGSFELSELCKRMMKSLKAFRLLTKYETSILKTDVPLQFENLTTSSASAR